MFLNFPLQVCKSLKSQTDLFYATATFKESFISFHPVVRLEPTIVSNSDTRGRNGSASISCNNYLPAFFRP